MYRYEGTNITGEKVVNHPKTQLNDALMESYRNPFSAQPSNRAENHANVTPWTPVISSSLKLQQSQRRNYYASSHHKVLTESRG